LWDAVRVLSRLFARAHEAFGVKRIPNRKRRAKRRALEVQNAGHDDERTKAYVDLLKVTKETVKAAHTVADALETHADPQAQELAEEIRDIVLLTLCVIDQTERRVLHGESVPAQDTEPLT
jgi:transposase, IS5 family